VARFAAFRIAVRTALRHFLFEFAFVRVDVTPGARTVFEAVWNDLGRIAFLAFCVALRASDRQMRAGQCESAFLMLRNCVSRRLESADCVARFALAVIRRGGELPVVHVLVTVETFCIGDLVLSRGTRRNVTFRTSHRSMFAEQRIRGGGVGLHVKE
jgi:hypothetical protein